MSRIIVYLAAVSLSLILASACVPGKPRTIAVTEKDAGSTVTMNQGDMLEVTLVGNPTTGYSWDIQSVDTSILKQMSDWMYKADNTTPGFVGSPGKQSVRFEAVGAGQTTLKMIYYRSFEPDVPPEQTFEITVIVK